MQAEIQALEQNCTFIVLDLPSGVAPIGNKWVYKIKRKSDGSIISTWIAFLTHSVLLAPAQELGAVSVRMEKQKYLCLIDK